MEIKRRTPAEWAKECMERMDVVQAEVSIREIIQTVIMRAVEEKREQCAKIAEEFAPYAACHKIAKKIREC